MATVRVKMLCTSKTDASVRFAPVMTGSEENAAVLAVPPCGDLYLELAPSALASFRKDNEYFVDVTPAPKPKA
jgi:hypothetical protein